MQIQETGRTSAATTATTARAEPKPAQQVDYMKLIVAQMQNLNPMDPNSGGDGMATMMQAESLNQLTKLNVALKDLQTMSQTGYASTLIGRTVHGLSAEGSAVGGTVSGLRMDSGGPILELSSGSRVRLLDVTEVAAT